MLFSVIIPTRNSAATLHNLLEDLQSQTYSPEQIIVADGQSTDGTIAIARKYNAEIVDNPARHAAGGRNRAAACAYGEWLAFTDSDCRLPNDWLERTRLEILKNRDLVAIAGPMLALPPRNEIEKIAGDAFLNGVMKFPAEQCWVKERQLHGAFITANVFYRRDIFMKVNGFDEWFENNAEDIDLFWRVLAQYPGKLLYNAYSPVYHCFPTTLRGLFRKWYGFGIASCRLQKRYMGPLHFDRSHYRRLTNSLWTWMRFPDQRSAAKVRVIQCVGHLGGKYCGSLKLRIVNI